MILSLINFIIIFIVNASADTAIFTIAYRLMTHEYWWTKHKQQDSSISFSSDGVHLNLYGNPIQAISNIWNNFTKPKTLKSTINKAIEDAEQPLLQEIVNSNEFKEKIKLLAMKKIEKDLEDLTKEDNFIEKKDDVNE
ncbi:MAG: hypothetical protein QXO65_03580 [Candidatus Aenigmatarchaeota archaeon]